MQSIAVRISKAIIFVKKETVVLITLKTLCECEHFSECNVAFENVISHQIEKID